MTGATTPSRAGWARTPRSSRPPRPRGLRASAALLCGLLSPACATFGKTDACDTLCDHARSAFEACLADQGLDWGTSVGFTSEQDFTDWCDTYAWEERQLDRGEKCAERQAIIGDGDCADWYTAWGDTP